MIRHYLILIVSLGASLSCQSAAGGTPAIPVPVAPVRMDRVWTEVCEFSEAISTFKVLLEDYRRQVSAGQISSEEAKEVLTRLSHDLNTRMYAQTLQAANVVAAHRRLDRPVLITPHPSLGPPNPYDLTDEVIAILNAQALP